MTKIDKSFSVFRLTFFFCMVGAAAAAPPSRITRPVDPARTVVVPGRIHSMAQPQYDRGAVDPSKRLNHVMVMLKPSAVQQAGLDALLVDQQNPSSPNFRKWLTPEQFGERFGVNSSDQSKIVAWLTGEGFTIDKLARSNNWVAFSGTAAQITKSLHTPIHQFQVDGETRFANTAPPSIPEAFSDVVSGLIGLDDFPAKSYVKMVPPEYTTGSSHFLAPADFTTIYDVNPLYTAGIDGTGQSIVVVGQSDVLLSDLRAFRTRYGLPANDPKMLLYSNTDPGFNGAQVEGNLDLEWAGAIAPKATINYVYGPNAFTAIVVAVEANIAPVISISYGSCEVDDSQVYYQSIAQQGNAQGITLLSASGDSGAAGCDSQSSEPFATRGKMVDFPAVLPEITAVGGTQFAEGSGTYWASANGTTFGSAMSYIPEAAWNESSTSGLGSTGGGASLIYPKPVWQNGPGVPNDAMRDVPDVALSSAGHDAYAINYLGSNVFVAGTSCAAPSMAGIIALLNQYQVTNKFQKAPGLGNINPQLYRLAQSVPTAFHDVTTGSNIVQCAQGSPDCSTGSFGYSAGPGYDLATGLGSVDANNLVTQWNTAVNGVAVTLSFNATKATLNDSVQMTATVAPASGSGTPTGTVNFVLDFIPLGNAPLVNGSATITVPLYTIGFTGTYAIAAQYSGDAAFSTGGATKNLQITNPSGPVTSIVPSGPSTVWPTTPDAQGLVWQTTIFLSETAGVPANLTGLTIDGVAQTLSQYFPSTSIEPKGTVSANFVFRGLTAPVTKTFVFTGTDPTGAAWSRQVAVQYFPEPTYSYFGLRATPLVVTQNTSADPSCQWSTQLNVDDLGGYGVNILTGLSAGRVDLTSKIVSIFGTRRLDAFGGLRGTICFSGITPPGTDSINVALGNGASFNIAVSFAGPPANPTTLTAAPATVSLAAASAASPATTTLAVNLGDKTQQWSASVFPANRTTSWLSASQLTGTGSGNITLTANGTGFEPGVYRATIVFQSQNAVPQYINVPVMFVLGGSSTTTISAVANAASYKTTASPGMLLGVFGTNLANTTATASGNPLAYSLAGVSAFINGLAAPVLYTSPGFLDIQVPYAVGAGPAVLGVNNNGQIAAYSFTVTPAAPGIFSDSNGNLVPSPTVAQGSALALYLTGAGDVNPAIKTAYAPSTSASLSSLPVPVLPLSVTVGGVPAFINFAGIPGGLIGVTQVNIVVPSSVPTGNQPIVVTVGGIASAPVNVVVQPAP
jgi:uncharacterized protein (TIGR03437 family)